MKPMTKGELKSVLQEYHMLLNYIERHKDIFEKAFSGIADAERFELQEKLKKVVTDLEELKEFCSGIVQADGRR